MQTRAKPKKRGEALADFGTGVLAWVIGAVFLVGGAWLFFGMPDPYPDTDSAPKQPVDSVEKIDRAEPPRQPLRSLEGIGQVKPQSDTPVLDELTRKYLQEPPPQSVEEGYVPSDQEIEEADREIREKVFGKRWSCHYAPTMNENWHDDVRCADGPNSHRPNLLADWGFVTEDDMRAAGQEYESYLNSGGTP